jgi:hypothetical protein
MLLWIAVSVCWADVLSPGTWIEFDVDRETLY